MYLYCKKQFSTHTQKYIILNVNLEQPFIVPSTLWQPVYCIVYKNYSGSDNMV